MEITDYDIINTLGRGGMGVVYRAVNRRTHQEVALKTVKIPNQNYLDCIRREIKALARLDHPGIVNIYDSGISDGLPWYSMDILEGRTLKQYCRDTYIAVLANNEQNQTNTLPFLERELLITKSADVWWTQSLAEETLETIQSETLPTGKKRTSEDQFDHSFVHTDKNVLPQPYIKDILTILRRLCLTLSYLHGQGIVHRDLKPDNIMIKSNGMPILVDFGLMMQFHEEVSRETLRVEKGSMGTINFMAPEQIRGDFVDSRADLYALGCMMYEMLTGQPPFPGSSITQIINCHLYNEVTPPSKIQPGIPKTLDSLILHLLDKNPHKRIGFADDVAAQLVKLGADISLPEKLPRSRSYLFRPTFNGRRNELTTIYKEIEKLQDSQGSFLLIGGESGVGKTRFIMEIGQRAAHDYIQIMTESCQDQLDQPLDGFKATLGQLVDRCHEKGNQEFIRLFGERAAVLAQYEPAIQSLIANGTYSDPPELPSEAARLRLFNYLWETLKVAADDTPLLIIIDDLQWADELSLSFIKYLLRNNFLLKFPIALLCSYRTEELTPDLENIITSEFSHNLILERLENQVIESIVTDMLALKPAPDLLIGHLIKHSEGNPFFVAEYLKAAVDEGFLWRDLENTWQIEKHVMTDQLSGETDGFFLPSSLKELITRRLKNLPLEAHDLLINCALIASDVPIGLLRELSRENEEVFFESIDELIRRQILRQQGPDLFTFDHNKIREIALSSIPNQNKAELHRKVGLAIEKLFRHDLEAHYAELGFHWKIAGNNEKAKAYFLQGARKAAKIHAHAEAEKLYRAYIDLIEALTPEGIVVRHEFGAHVLQFQGKYQEAWQIHLQAVDDARLLSDEPNEAANLHALGTIKWIMGDLRESKELIKQALDLQISANDELAQARSLSSLAILERDLSDADRAISILDDSIKILERLGDQKTLAQTLANKAILQRDRGNLEDAQSLCKRAIEISRDIGDKRSEGITLSNLAVIPWDQGQWEEGLQLYKEALEILKPVGDRRAEAIVRSSLANVYQELGQFEIAYEYYHKALEMHREVGESRWEAYSLQGLATVHRRMTGEIQKSQIMLDKALEIFTKMELLVERITCLCQMGHNNLCRNESARQQLETAKELSNNLHSIIPYNDIQNQIDHLERAQTAFEEGLVEKLFRGELLDSIPDRMLNYYLSQGLLSPDLIHHDKLDDEKSN